MNTCALTVSLLASFSERYKHKWGFFFFFFSSLGLFWWDHFIYLLSSHIDERLHWGFCNHIQTNMAMYHVWEISWIHRKSSSWHCVLYLVCVSLSEEIRVSLLCFGCRFPCMESSVPLEKTVFLARTLMRAWENL